MFRRQTLLASLFLMMLGFSFSPSAATAQKDDDGWSRKYKEPPPASRIEVTVVKAFNGKPIENAAVIFHPIEGDRDKGALELKTNEDGKAIINVIPIGDTVRLQVIANGYQTYGQDYKVDKAAMSMEVKLRRPVAQYSTYGNSSSSPSGSAKSNPGSSSDKSSGSGSQSSSGDSSGSGNSSGSGSQQTPPATQPK